MHTTTAVTTATPDTYGDVEDYGVTIKFGRKFRTAPVGGIFHLRHPVAGQLEFGDFAGHAERPDRVVLSFD